MRRKTYEKRLAVLKTIVEATTDPAYMAYAEAIAPAEKAFSEALAAARKALLEATDPAWKALRECIDRGDKDNSPAYLAAKKAQSGA